MCDLWPERNRGCITARVRRETGTHCCLMSDKCALRLGIKLFRMQESSKMSQEVEGNTHMVCNDVIRRLACETGAMQCVQSTLIRFLVHQIQSIWKLKGSFVFQMQLKHLKLMVQIKPFSLSGVSFWGETAYCLFSLENSVSLAFIKMQ